MRRDFNPSPLALAFPTARWLLLFMAISGFGRWWEAFALFTALFLFHIAFHRNPNRRSAETDSVLTSPADGRVTDITEVEEKTFIKGRAVRVGIFLSVFDVHTQPSPCDAKLVHVDYQPGKFLDARDPDATSRNESQILGLETTDGTRLIVKQISGKIARRIILWRQKDEEVLRGELLGMIRYGSRVELILPEGFAEILVRPGDVVRGGATAMARKIPGDSKK